MIELFILVAVVSVWFLWCNEKTYRQRQKLVRDSLKPLPEWESTEELLLWFKRRLELLDTMSIISYEKHMWYLITFRNPMKLYGDK